MRVKAKLNKELIESYIKVHNLSKNQFCKIANISKPTLHNILKDVGICSIFIAGNLCRTLKVRLEELIVKEKEGG